MKEIDGFVVYLISLIVCFFLGITLWKTEIIPNLDTLGLFVFGFPIVFAFIMCRIKNGIWF